MASTELSVYQKMSDPIAAMREFGNAIAKSGIFTCATLEAGQVLAMECMHRGLPPLALAERYHIIFGKLSMKSDAMLAEFCARGGKHKLKARKPERAAIELSRDGQTETFELTWEEALKEPFVYEGKEADVIKLLAAGKTPTIKAKYSTPRARMQMLWARVVSDGVRVMDPGVNCGRYTPEELGDPDEPVKSSGNGHVKSVSDTVVESAVTPDVETDSIEAEFVVVKEQPAETVMASGVQVNRIKNLYVALSIPLSAQENTLKSRGVSSLFAISATDAEEIIGKLEQLRDSRATAAAIANPPILQERNDAPASIERIQIAQRGLSELEQTQPGISAKVVGHLKSSGLSKWTEMTVDSIEQLIQFVMGKQLDEFFRLSLTKAVVKETATATESPPKN